MSPNLTKYLELEQSLTETMPESKRDDTLDAMDLLWLELTDEEHYFLDHRI